MWLSLVLVYTMFFVGTVSNYFLLQWVRNDPHFNADTEDQRLVAFEFVDSLHQLVFSVFFSIFFFLALARIELLIEVLTDLEKNKREFRRHKIVYGAIVANKIVHSIVSYWDFKSQQLYTPNIKTDSNPFVLKVTYAIYSI